MSQNLTAHEWPLNKVFSSDFEFTIPAYQRPYRWGAEQALQLLDDLEDVLDREGEVQYFLGSVVLVNQGVPKYDVIDGQQRLTTLSILIALLRDLADDPGHRSTLGSMVMESGVALDGIPAKPRLALREQDADFFTTHVQTPESTDTLVTLSDATALTDPQRAIRDNARALRSRLVEWSDLRRSDLATLLRTKTYLVVVTTVDLDSAYRIFSVMNARGLDLAPADIFKSTVLGAMEDSSDASKKWEAAEEALGTDAFSDLFRDIRTIVSGERARLELLKEFPSQVLGPYLEGNTPGAFLDDLLLPYASAFEATITAELGVGPEWTETNTALRRLARIDNKDWRPAALWAIVHFKNDPEALGATLRCLERLAASLLLRGVYSTPRIERYLGLLAELKDGLGANAPSLELTADERKAALQALNGDVYRMQSRRARHVLLTLDELMKNTVGVEYTHSIISIEHVLPQSPTSESTWVTNFDEEQRELWTHKLGNLLLLNRRKNSQASNYDFEKKKRQYFTGSSGSAVFALTTQVLQHDEWTPEVVAARQQKLVGILGKEWGLI